MLPRSIGDRIPTPALLVDLELAESNMKLAASQVADTSVQLRPHFKAHKCTKLLRMQLAAGQCAGVACQTSWEALVLARCGFDNILVSNEIVDPFALGELADAAAMAQVSVVVDDVIQVDLLQESAQQHDIIFDVLIELDVGSERCGVPIGDDRLLRIADRLAGSANLRLAGLQAYEGHAGHVQDLGLRRQLVEEAGRLAGQERLRLESAGFEVETVSGGGTGTLEFAAEVGVLSEVQCGSYVLMDARYRSLGLPFENALFCISRVISRRTDQVGVLNVGLKELTVEYGMPEPVMDGVRVTALSDEHANLEIAAGVALGIGDIVHLIPAHIDPAVNLHDALFVWDGRSQSLETWPVDGRRVVRSLQ